MRTRSMKLIFRTAMVTRPMAVLAKRYGPSQRKWRCHEWRRGWKSRVSLFVTGSMPATLVPLWLLHGKQASARFPAAVRPACFRATTWSISWLNPSNSSGIRQYSQQKRARSRTRSSSLRFMRFGGLSHLTVMRASTAVWLWISSMREGYLHARIRQCRAPPPQSTNCHELSPQAVAHAVYPPR